MNFLNEITLSELTTVTLDYLTSSELGFSTTPTNNPNCPTIISPNGGELFITTELTISWSQIVQDSPVVYEIYYTDDYSSKREPEWKLISIVPSSVSQYIWRYGSVLSSSKVRVAIRSRDQIGERSDFSISAANFSIRRTKIQPPIVISPVSGKSYSKQIQIVVDNNPLIGTYSQRSFYQFYYSSVKAQISKTPVAQNVQIGSSPVIWNITKLPPADDYILQVYLSDNSGNTSESVFIKNIVIGKSGFFIVDTTPPVGAIIINNNATFTMQQAVTTTLVAYDATTGVQSMQLSDDGGGQSKPDTFSDSKNYILSSGDAVKAVQLELQDFGGNRNNQITQRLFQTQLEIDNTAIADIALDRTNNLIWAVTDGQNSNYLYQITDFPTRKATLTDTPTAVAVYNTTVYIATQNSSNLGSLVYFNGSSITLVNSFSDSDSIVNSMVQYGQLLYIGMENGNVYSFDGLNFDIIDTLLNPIQLMFSDGNLLYLTLKDSFTVYVFNGTNFFSTGG